MGLGGSGLERSCLFNVRGVIPDDIKQPSQQSHGFVSWQNRGFGSPFEFPFQASKGCGFVRFHQAKTDLIRRHLILRGAHVDGFSTLFHQIRLQQSGLSRIGGLDWGLEPLLKPREGPHVPTTHPFWGSTSL